jgi:hypothetical protein
MKAAVFSMQEQYEIGRRRKKLLPETNMQPVTGLYCPSAFLFHVAPAHASPFTSGSLAQRKVKLRSSTLIAHKTAQDSGMDRNQQRRFQAAFRMVAQRDITAVLTREITGYRQAQTGTAGFARA